MFRGEKQQGFTLIELIVVLALIAIIVTLSTPVSNLFTQNRVTSQVHEFVTSLNMARSAAVAHGNPASLCVSDGNSPPACSNDPNANWENGWLVFTDANSNCLIDDTDEMLRQHEALSEGFTLRFATNKCITYTANGITPNTNGTLKLCDPSKKPSYKRGINIAISGRAQILDVTEAQNQGINLAGCP